MIALAISAATAGPATAADEPGLKSSQPWTLDYDTDSCALRRIFGEGDNSAYLELRRFGPRSGLQAIVASNRMKPRNPAHFKFRLTPAEADWNEVEWAPTLSMSNGFDGVVFSFSFPEEEEDDDEPSDAQEEERYRTTAEVREAEKEFAANTDGLVVRGAFRKEIALDLGSMEKPIAALNECIDELMTHWNIDVEAYKSLTRPAWPIDFPESASMVGYPPKMARQSMPGLVNVRLAIDEAGRVSACRIQMPLSDPEFEASSCADIQHAFEFEPALDKEGKPIASFWTTKVKFQIGP